MTFLILLALAALAVFSRLGGPAGRGDDRARYHGQTFLVARVVDGDTFDIAAADGARPTTRIRLWGVDTPEVAGSRDGAMHFGAEASAYAKETLEGEAVRIVLAPQRTRGKYGRLLAYAYVESGDEMFNEMLLRSGHAYADWRFDHPYKRRFENIERRAQRDGVGLWADVTAEQFPAWRRRMEQQREER